MDVIQQTWSGGRHSRSSSSGIQPPWECDIPSVTSPQDASPSPHHHASNGGLGGYGSGGSSYLDSSSLPPSPLEALYRRTASFSSRSPSPHQDTVTVSSSHFHHHGRSVSISGIPSDGARRQSLSGPLPSSEEQSPMMYSRRPSLSGPLPNSSNNPYSAFDNDEFMRTPSPWNSYHATVSAGTNPYLNPYLSPNGSISVSSNSLGGGSPSSLPRPPSHSNGNESPSIASPGSVGNGYSTHHLSSPRVPPVRQLYGFSNGNGASSSKSAAPTDPFASLVSSSLSSHPASASPANGEQWACFPTTNSSQSQRTHPPIGKPMASALSQRTHGTPTAPTVAAGGKPNGATGGDSNGNGNAARVSPNLTRSRSVHNGAFHGNGNGGTLPFNARSSTLNRSLSCSGAEARKYSKGRGGLGEGVLETLVAQLVFAQEKPSMLADMIFCPSKLYTGTVRDSKGPFAYARDLVERILLAQVHALTSSFKVMAEKPGEFEKESWALQPFKNGKVQERFPNEGYRLLRLQTQFVEAGLETFDMLCRVRKQFSSLIGDDGGANSGLLRIACFGGGPGCEALAIRLFFMRLLPSLQLQVDILDRRERWKQIVDNISLKGVGLMTVDLFDVVFHPTWLRSYRLLVFFDSLGVGVKFRRSHNWPEFWSNLFRNTSPGVVVIVLEKTLAWEEMKPTKGSNWWCSALAEQEFVHVARKM